MAGVGRAILKYAFGILWFPLVLVAMFLNIHVADVLFSRILGAAQAEGRHGALAGLIGAAVFPILFTLGWFWLYRWLDRRL
jgi:hypothetical protein